MACTDVEMDYSRLPAGKIAQNAWQGNAAPYVDKIFTRAATADAGPLSFPALVPNNTSVFKRYAGKYVPYAAIACYPTTASNARAEHVLPTGDVIPHMQRAGERPIFADENAKYPLLVLSHGLGGSPLEEIYVAIIKQFAAEGYIVVAPFHADARFFDLTLDSVSGALKLLSDYPLVAETMAMRGIGIEQTLNYFLPHAGFADHIDQRFIGGWGASLGAQALMINQGAKLTTSISGGTGEVVITDKRIKALVGFVPFSGIDYSPFISLATFGTGNAGVRGIRTPYMAIGGTKDDVAPLSQTRNVVRNMSGSRYLVEIEGMEHRPRGDAVTTILPDTYAWTLLFYKAHLFGDAQARAQLARTSRFSGVAPDTMTLARTLPWWAQDEVTVVEYYNAQINHYFMTALDAEKQYLDGNASLGWARTGESFTAWRAISETGSPVFRFYHDARGVGVNTHFFTVDAPEAGTLRARPQEWTEEQGGWRAFSVGSGCPEGYAAITRAYNNRFAFGDSNHRFMTRAETINEMRQKSWIIEGQALCVAQP